MSYEFADRPLYTRKALDLLEERQQSFSGGAVGSELGFAVEESDMLEDYLETLEPYDEVLRQGYEDISNVPRPEVVLGRIEDDMDRLARGRHQLLDETVSTGETRREALGGFLSNEEYDTPVMTDTWIMMKEAEKLRENL